MPTVKLRAGGYMLPVELNEVGDRWTLGFRYSPALIAEVKAMEGARWNPNSKSWSVARSPRNKFALAYLMGKDVYAQYEAPLIPFPTRRRAPCGHKPHYGPCPECGCGWCMRPHQMVMLSHALTRRRSILAGKPGTGKTVVAIEALETLGGDDVAWYVGPDSAINGAIAEFKLHKSLVTPRFLTYDSVKRVLATWKDGDPPPRRVIMDESSRVKGHKTQRSEACLFLSHQMAAHWKGEEFLLLMSGTPDPNEPVDWWMQAEIACPGFLKEGSWYALRKRLAIIVERQGLHGYYPHLIQWKDGKECKTCAERSARAADEQKALAQTDADPKQKALLESILLTSHDDSNCEYCGGTGRVPDEVELLSKRLDGLVLKVEKPDLPDKQYRIIEIPVAPDVLRAAQVVAETATNALDALNRLRQLSDGFLYDKDTHIAQWATGSPKEQALVSLLDEYEDQGRVLIYAAYTASIERVAEVCKERGWLVWRYDGKDMSTWDGRSFEEAYAAFQHRTVDGKPQRFPAKVAYVAHPQKGGMSLTLTASVCAIYYSNDFMGESREQSEDRIHRMGMDENKGATIIDLIHLPTDRLVRDRLMEKRGMSQLTAKHLRDALRGF